MSVRENLPATPPPAAATPPAGTSGETEVAAAGRAPLVAVATAAFLVLLKAATAWRTGSLALGAAALDSAVDVFISSASYFVVRRSAAPPDADHAYGHGRFETLAALGQGLLLIGGAAGLMVGGWLRFGTPQAPRAVPLGLAVLAAAIAGSWLASVHLGRAAARLESQALEADSVHYRADLWINAGAFLALVLAHWAKLPAADPLMAMLVSLVVLRSGVRLAAEALGDLSDRGLPADELRRIAGIVAGFAPGVRGMHGLRTRRSGVRRLIELHLEIPHEVSFEEAHRRGSEVRRAIEAQLAHSRVLVHNDPV